MVKSDNQHTGYLKRLEKNLKRALILGGYVVKDKAQEFAPVLTATMMASVDITTPRWEGDELVVRVGTGPEAPYAKYTELEEYLTLDRGEEGVTELRLLSGRKQLGPKSLAKGTARMPWLKPALDDQRDNCIKIINAAITNTR